MSDTQSLSASLEDYLEVIYGLVKKDKVARGRDISRRMGVTGASVTGALRALSERKLVNYAPYEVVTLTRQGERVAAEVVGRHKALKDFFVSVLGVDEKEAGENACRIEHAVSENLMKRLIRFAEFVRVCPQAGGRWVERFGRYCEYRESGLAPAGCERSREGAEEGADRRAGEGQR